MDQNEERPAVRPEWLTWSSQPIYDTDGESCISIIADEDSLNLHSSLPHIINETGNQQPSFLEDEEESKEEILEQDENSEPSLEKEEAKVQAPAQEYLDRFMELKIGRASCRERVSSPV